MKNKFLHGAAALALCAGFVACSEYDAGVAPETLAEIKSLQYETAFVQKFGKIDPTQDWGFGSTNAKETRATRPDVVDNPTNDRSVYQPDGFTANQKEIIRLFFQNNKYLTGISYPYTEFFAQQIYKGNTNVGTGTGSASDCYESYEAADKNWYDAGVMNQFEVGPQNNHFHIDSFNNGSYQRGNESGMYAVDADASMFGYTNSANAYITGNYVIIDGATIDAWAQGAGASILRSLNIPFESVATCTSRTPDGDTKTIKRYYLGFDFVLYTLENDEIYAKGYYDSQLNQWIPDGIAYYEFKGNKYPYLITDMNMYCGDVKDYNDVPNEETIAWLLNNGYLPVSGKADKTWVKVATCANGYYSDWIISITPGKPGTPEKQPVLTRRVFCEDLGSIGDFDFNDVVFDVTIYDDKTVDIEVLAAGGTLYIEVEGRSIHTDLGMPYMVNTIVDGAKCDPVVIETRTTADLNENALLQYIKDIEIKVYQTNPQNAKDIEGIVLTAEEGKAPQKICVPKGTRWMQEYIRINTGYKKFSEWVKGGSSLEDTFNESNADPSLLY